MKPKTARKLRNILLLAGTAVMLLGSLWEGLFPAGVCITFSCLIPQILFYKCPHCGKQLGGNDGTFCQFCGGRIDG